MAPPWAPGTRVKPSQGNQIFNVWKKISATWDQGSPDQVEGQPVDDEGLEGSCSQSQVELETLLRGWAPHAVRAQGCSPQRTHLEERSTKAGPGGDMCSRAGPGEEPPCTHNEVHKRR